MNKKIIIFDFDGVLCDSFLAGMEVMRELSGPWRFRYVAEEADLIFDSPAELCSIAT